MIYELEKVLKYQWKINDCYVSGPLTARHGFLAISVEPSFDVQRALAPDQKHIAYTMISTIPQLGGRQGRGRRRSIKMKRRNMAVQSAPDGRSGGLAAKPPGTSLSAWGSL